MGPSLPTAPQEIKDCIIDFLCQGSLFALLRCSRAFYQMTLPYLYRHVDLDQTYNRHGNLVFPQVYGFACRVLSDSRLAAFVKSLTIARQIDAINYSKAPREPLHALNGSIKEVVELLCRNLPHRLSGESEWDSWLRAIQLSGGESEAVLALLLPYLSHLERLHVPLHGVYTYFCGRMLRRAGDPSRRYPDTAFKSLKCVSMVDDGSGGPYMNVIPVLAMPALVEINIEPLWYRMLEGMDPDLVAKYLQKGSLGVTSMSFNGAGIRPLDVICFVEACRKLRKLRIAWSQPGKGWWSSIDLEDLYVALQSVASSLEELTLEYQSPLPPTREMPFGYCTPLQCLVHLPELKHLKLSMAFIFGFQDAVIAGSELSDASPRDAMPAVGTLTNLLPPNLETLHVVRHKNEDLDLLCSNINTAITAISHGRFPSLKSITVESKFAGWDFEKPDPRLGLKDLVRGDIRCMMGELEEHAAGAGVELRWAATFG